MATVSLFCYADAALTGPVGGLYRDIADQAALADSAGYARFWLTEQHLSARGRVPDSLQALAFLAARTARIRLATGVLPAAVHDPVLAVESVLQLDALSGGRVDLGIGSGSEAGPILDVLGVGEHEPAERTADLYALLAKVAPGVVPELDGRALELDPPPAGPLIERVWTAAGRHALELAERYGTGLLLPRPMPLPARVELARAYRAVVPDGRVAHFAAGFVAGSAAETRRLAAPFVQDYARRYLGVEAGGPDTAAFADAAERLELLLGEAPVVAEAIRARLKDFDAADEVAIQLAGPGVAGGDVLDAIERLAPELPGLAA
ncbi:LLM class flavin-dependent oxidoreductase [Amnibacterium sp. CER49]|uniref:LLM class flavin-dependent oxidoreductase n=1 Tax=Amnibacterium sp. CER49 TaxID=3039161 RepID=UPI0024482F0B|nr:LLM class flavin-dependent oxidoreductase [Amnibacterium sp. CER49]MDH2444159.1 LLM class flavin-dependent oxidoreductase [Amnibacterium sp. CER49]